MRIVALNTIAVKRATVSPRKGSRVSPRARMNPAVDIQNPAHVGNRTPIPRSSLWLLQLLNNKRKTSVQKFRYKSVKWCCYFISANCIEHEVRADLRRIHSGELHNLYSSPNIIRVIKSRRMRWFGQVARMGDRSIQGSGGETWRKRTAWKTQT